MKKNTPGTVEDQAGDLEFLDENIRKPAQEPIVKGVAKYIRKRWTTIEEEFKPVRREMVRSMRRVRGEYEPTKLTKIKAFKGSTIYNPVLEAKARSAQSWVEDIYRGENDLPWVIEPTAVPDLPDEKIQEIEEQTKMKAIQMEQQITASGAVVDRSEIAKMMQAYYDEQIEKEVKRIERKAKTRCNVAAKEIRDQGQEGGFNPAFKDFLWFFVRLKYGVLKGPNLSKRAKQEWIYNEEAQDYEIQTVETLVNDVYSPSPFNIWFERGMTDINDGDVIEVHEMSPQSLMDLIGVAGYSEEEIRYILKKHAAGDLKRDWFKIDDKTQVEQVTKQVKNDQISREDAVLKSKKDMTILAMEFWGTLSGKMLKEWGAEGELDDEKQYQANCWMIDGHVFKAVINPDPLGRKPYHVSSWAKNPSWIVGSGLVEFGAPIEDSMNAVLRALQNNVAIASGPMCEIDKDRVETSIPIYPWRQIESTSLQMRGEGDAVKYYQPQMHAQELTIVYQFLGKLLDEMTVPAYAQGMSQAGVTTGTATVFTSLLAAASRSIKAVVANIDDDIITPYIQMCYDFNMKYSRNNQSKGDARVIAKGVAGLLAREQAAQRKVEYLQVISNPTYQQILGQQNIGAILQQLAKANDIKLPDEKRLTGEVDISAMLDQMLMAQAGVDPMQALGQVPNGGGAPQTPRATLPDGGKPGVVQ